MSRPIGYYVHHHGDGHRQRAMAIAEAAGRGITLLGTGLASRTGNIPCVDLADDRMKDGRFDGSDYGERPSSLHYAPIDHEGVRHRVAQLTEWIADVRPGLLVIDVSVEIAMLARLASVPTVYVRLSGRRLDRPHLDAFRGAAALLAPFHPDLDDERTPSTIRRKTFYAPAIVRPEPQSKTPGDAILVVIGRGGGTSDGSIWAEAARALPSRRWQVIGHVTVPPNCPDNLELRGWVDDADRMIASASVVIGGTGDGLVSSVLSHRRPFITVPEKRPFEEQRSKAARLAANDAAIVLSVWPAPERWPELISRAEHLDQSRLGRLTEAGGADRVSRWLQMLSDETSRLRRLSA